jgi:hypothetical protein
MIALYSETPPQRLERMKRWRDAGWLRFTFFYSLAMALVFPVALAWIMGFFIGYSYTFRVLLLLAPFAVIGVMGSQFVWITLPISIELLEETDSRRKASWLEANALVWIGAVLAFGANFLPFHIGRIAAEADLMMLISGTVVCAWGLVKMLRYWRTSPQWKTHTPWGRFMRTYLTTLGFLIAIASCLVRAYACYGDAAWAEPVRRLIY